MTATPNPADLPSDDHSRDLAEQLVQASGLYGKALARYLAKRSELDGRPYEADDLRGLLVSQAQLAAKAELSTASVSRAVRDGIIQGPSVPAPPAHTRVGYLPDQVRALVEKLRERYAK